ncbi:Abhydrolase-3 domain-containing protein [Mycena venus]|uniref:Abhydrolase-3 domain-containing protein n=1 Tax=Mycena venus TaxID=2733690 RepID=A0A8H6XPL4_9AGAR|nr:Abhydrolase-3 domain-containing protein [Mycena venus]
MAKDALYTGYAPLRHQPVKAVYLLYELLAAFVRVPYWALVAIPPVWRPRRSWSWARTMVVNIVRRMDIVQARAGDFTTPPSYLALVPGKGYHGVWVDPTPKDYIVGKVAMWAKVSGASPIRLPGYWIHEPNSSIPVQAPHTPGEKVVYALHGGAYTRFSAHPSEVPGQAARGMLEYVESVHRTFSIEYRLSSTAPFAIRHPFPTALIDAVTGYHYLVATLGIPPADIIVMGDSAGGNLALALVRYLVEYQIPILPPPGAFLLLSPWADLGTSHETPGSSLETCATSDFLAPPAAAPRSNFLHWSIRAFTGPLGLGAAETNAYISPASKHIMDADVPFTNFPRTFISSGGAEILLDSIRTLYARMERDMGAGNGKVRYLEAEDSVHDLLLIPGLQEPQREESRLRRLRSG